MGWLKRRGYYLWVTFSMCTCSILFFPWFLPRETVSGLLGRWIQSDRGIKRWFALKCKPWIERYLHEPFGLETCEEIYELEEAARKALYIRGELD